VIVHCIGGDAAFDSVQDSAVRQGE